MTNPNKQLIPKIKNCFIGFDNLKRGGKCCPANAFDYY